MQQQRLPLFQDGYSIQQHMEDGKYYAYKNERPIQNKKANDKDKIAVGYNTVEESIQFLATQGIYPIAQFNTESIHINTMILLLQEHKELTPLEWMQLARSRGVPQDVFLRLCKSFLDCGITWTIPVSGRILIYRLNNPPRKTEPKE